MSEHPPMTTSTPPQTAAAAAPNPCAKPRLGPEANRHPGPSDHQIELSVAAMLRFGVTLAAVIVAIGGALMLRHPHAPAPDLRHFDPAGLTFESFGAVFVGVRALRPAAIVQLGLIVLIATPVARVLFCVVGFARQRDRLYVTISLIVLAVLTYSFLHSAH